MKVFLRTFGCRANHYDSEAVRAMLERAGHSITDRVDDADAAVFNSCAVTSAAEADLRKSVRRAARRRPEMRSVIMGCAAALDGERTGALALASLPTVAGVVPGAELPLVAAALGLEPSAIAPIDGTARQTSTRAVLRVQDGCDEHCTFCATTMARGANRGRPVDDLVREATRLAEWHSEIVITGIHIGTYGVDVGVSLGALMQRLVRDVPGVRFRLSSIEATEVDDALVELLAGDPLRVAPHIHAPLQSGSDRVLKRMGRNWYTSATYAAVVERIAARVPVLGLGADVLAGFPGETDADHDNTMALVRDLPFTYLHVFPFSLRPGTAAERLTGHVAPEMVSRRAAALRAVGEEKSAAHARVRDGGSADVIVVGSGEREGVTEDFLTVALDDARRPRGERFDAQLVWDGARLVAHAAAVARGM